MTATRLAVVGLGTVGQYAVRACADRADVEVVAGVVFDEAKAHRDLGELVGTQPSGIFTTTDFDDVLRRSDVDVVLYCGLGDARAVGEVLGRCVDHGKDAITVAGLVHPPTALGKAGAASLARRASRGGGRIVGTGINPGLLLDVLPTLIGSLVHPVEHVWARRVSEIRTWGDGVLASLGIGSTCSSEPRAPDWLAESCALVADALALRLDQTESAFAQILSERRRIAGRRVVEAGTVCGFRLTSTGSQHGQARCEFEWIGMFAMSTEHDGLSEGAGVRVTGQTSLELELRGSLLENGSHEATAIRALNAIGPLRSLPPGLYRPDQLPLSISA